MNFNREYINGDPDTFLGYITDPSLDFTFSGKTSYKYNKTIALSNSTGDSYQYPKACFLGNKQVYPPIMNEEIHNVIGQFNETGAFVISIPGAKISEKSYIFPNTFKVETYSGYTTQAINYNDYLIPSFDPTQSNNTKWAYQSGSNIYIKDPLLTKKIPHVSSYEFTVKNNINYNFNNSGYYSGFKVYLNPNNDGPELLKTSYNITNYPISYTLANNTVILRRQCPDIDLETMPFLEYVTSKEANTASGGGNSYYTYRYYWKGNEINANDLYAYVMPYNGVGSTKIPGTTDQYYAGSNPTYFARNYNNFSNWNANFTLQDTSGSEPIDPTHLLSNFSSYRGSMFNLYFIKVNGNENMNSFGQRSKYVNHLSYNASTAINNAPAHGISTAHVNVQLNSPISNKIAMPVSTFDDIQHVDYVNIPKKNSEIVKMRNMNFGPYYGAIGFRHKTSNYLNIMNSNTFTYVSYSRARDLKDVTDINLQFSSHSSGEITTTVIIDSNPEFSSYLYTATASSHTQSYAYCYLAADIISQYGLNFLIVNRVLSESYVAIRSFQCQTGQTVENTTTYNIHLKSLDD